MKSVLGVIGIVAVVIVGLWLWPMVSRYGPAAGEAVLEKGVRAVPTQVHVNAIKQETQQLREQLQGFEVKTIKAENALITQRRDREDLVTRIADLKRSLEHGLDYLKQGMTEYVISGKNWSRQEVESELSTQSAELERLRRELEIRDTTIEATEQTLEQARIDIVKLRTAIAQRDHKLAELESRDNAAELQEQLAKFGDEASSIHGVLSNSSALKVFEDVVRDKEAIGEAARRGKPTKIDFADDEDIIARVQRAIDPVSAPVSRDPKGEAAPGGTPVIAGPQLDGTN